MYRYRYDLAADDVSMETLFLHRHHSTPTQGDDRFLLLWDATWQRPQPGWELNLFGIKPVTWFHHESSPASTAHRLFPLYRYQRDDETKTRDWDALLLWWHRENEQRLRDIFLPIVDIEHDRQRDLLEVGVLGIRPLTFFQYLSSPTGFSHSAALLYKYGVEGEHQRLSAIG